MARPQATPAQESRHSAASGSPLGGALRQASLNGASRTTPLNGALRPRRSPRLIVIGVLCICLGALAAAFAYQQATSSQSVLIVQRPLSRGQTIQTGDLGIVSMSKVPGAAVVPASQLSGLLGQQALTDLSAGTILSDGSVGTPAVAPGTSLVGLRLLAGRLPTHGVGVGAQVTLIAVPGPKDPVGTQVAGFQVNAVVDSTPSLMSDGQSYLLDVLVPADSAAQLASLAAAERLVLIRRPG